jgi:hypothetical protein
MNPYLQNLNQIKFTLNFLQTASQITFNLSNILPQCLTSPQDNSNIQTKSMQFKVRHIKILNPPTSYALILDKPNTVCLASTMLSDNSKLSTAGVLLNEESPIFFEFDELYNDENFTITLYDTSGETFQMAATTSTIMLQIEVIDYCIIDYN